MPELIMRIGGEDDKENYVKFRGDHGNCGPVEGFEELVEPMKPSFPKKLASLWYWIWLTLLLSDSKLLHQEMGFYTASGDGLGRKEIKPLSN
ncbi:unnamed protein product [Prunus armeniaca]|uniref:Uncharacterized protein n=1 Tax=Prunus armeniaca TaxID=36596 RepID=A0A6J5X9K9_PRUAR|nr:unnamed protein product [Prunus armeniaca]